MAHVVHIDEIRTSWLFHPVTLLLLNTRSSHDEAQTTIVQISFSKRLEKPDYKHLFVSHYCSG